MNIYVHMLYHINFQNLSNQTSSFQVEVFWVLMLCSVVVR